ncbi:hypothetical protein [Hyphococcus sp.]|uniref:hypothetical protein n=1 Tax=Hyphococcus sp. TaxID=2038636 RepID=UPI003CCC28E4
MFDQRTIVSTSLLCTCLLLVGACGGENASAPTDTKTAEKSETSSAATNIDFDRATFAFFEDLPDANDVSEAEMGDLYFKLLTRITTKVRAVNNEKAAAATRELIDYAHAQAMLLEERSEALPEGDKSKLFQDSLSQIMWAERQYGIALRRISDDDPKYMRDFAAYADKDWPRLR